MAELIAVVNAGSSSVKFAFYDREGDKPLLLKGQVEQIGVSPSLSARDGAGNVLKERNWGGGEGFSHRNALRAIFEMAREHLPGSTVKGVGHRVVHGGARFATPVEVTANVIAELEKLSPLAPLHQPHNLALIKAIAEDMPHIQQIACFDTAFHQTQPHLAQAFALPRDISESGVRRYGFHGLSYEFVSARLRNIAPDHADKRIIIAHLGNGASLCGIHGSKSVATTMGFTTADGLMMGTRCGSIDPGVLIYMMDERGMGARELEELVYKQSGLLGVSGISSDMRTLRRSDDPRAREAIDLFVYRIVRGIGSLAAALGGLEGIAFTGGIGTGDAETRREVAAGCAWLGAVIDEGRNADGDGLISSDYSRLPMWVVPTDEERVIARHTAAVLRI